MKLSKKSNEQLWRQFNGTGVVFLKLSDAKIAIIEFHQGRNRKFYTSTNHPVELTEYVYGLAGHIEEDAS